MTRIRYEQIQVGSIKGASGMFHGDNRQYAFKSIRKVNQAFGTVTGEENEIACHRSSIDDRDQADLWIRGKYDAK